MSDPFRGAPADATVGAASAAPPSPAQGASVADVLNVPADFDWLALGEEEEVLEPDLAIVDAHHHMWDRPGSRYLTPDLLMDIAGGHKVVATVYVENNAAYRSYGPIELHPVGETEVMAAIGEGWVSDDPCSPRTHAGIVGYADLFAGAAVRAVLEAHLEVGRGRFRGIRQVTAWDPAPSIQVIQHGPRRPLTEGMLSDGRFRAGFACLEPLSLTFDAWLYHPQLGELIDLAWAVPGPVS